MRVWDGSKGEFGIKDDLLVWANVPVVVWQILVRQRRLRKRLDVGAEKGGRRSVPLNT